MKKFVSVSLAVVLAAGLFLSGNSKAEAMNNVSAALLTASLVLFGLPFVAAVTRDPYRPAPVYGVPFAVDPYPVHTTVIYKTPRYERDHRHDWRSSSRYDRGWRGPREYERDCDHARSRYPYGHDRY